MIQIDRRSALAGVLGLAAAFPGLGRAAVPASRALQFGVFRNGKPFGQYKVAFTPNGDLMTVVTDVAMSARVAGLLVFDYQHHCEETWRGPDFLEMKSHSVRDKGNSLNEEVTATRTDLAVRVTTKRDHLSLARDAKPFTHWNAAVLQGPMFNPQDGAQLFLTANAIGRSPATLASGAKLDANRWAVRGDNQAIDEWYDDAGVWAGLTSRFPDKSIVEYRRV
jgi:hypothetical protein